MMENKGLKQNLSWNTIGMVLYNLAIWLFSVLILRMLGSEASGYYAVACSIGNTLYALALWGMRSFIVSDRENAFSGQDYLSARFCSILLAAVLGIVIALTGPYNTPQKQIVVLYTLYKCSEAGVELMDCFGQRKMTMSINAVSMILRSVLLTVFFWFSLRFFRSMNLAFVMAAAITVLVGVFYNSRRIGSLDESPAAHKTIRRPAEVLKACFPIMLFEMLSALVVAVPRLFFERGGNISELGYYTTVYTMVVFLQLVINVLIYTIAPYMAKARSEGEDKQFHKYMVFLFLAAAGLSLLAEGAVALFGRPVLSLLMGSQAGLRYHYLYLGIISGASLAVTWILGQILVILHREKDQLICSVLAALSSFVFSFFLIDGASADRISLVLILTNLVFILAASLLLLVKKGSRI